MKTPNQTRVHVHTDGQARLRDLGIGPTALGRVIGTTKPAASLILRGQTIPTEEHARTIESILRVPRVCWRVKPGMAPEHLLVLPASSAPPPSPAQVLVEVPAEAELAELLRDLSAAGFTARVVNDGEPAVARPSARRR